ncbi:MAG: type III-B CRISPR module RAMP protein Cmr1 [Actinomycetota bacterium]|nr:type III-B CRISPR module RAMP protein Cmr1 [Actinomycetota bacterium]
MWNVLAVKYNVYENPCDFLYRKASMNNGHAIEIKIKTLTPLWTGSVDGKCDRLHETGIIGSMRWWYEAIVRGLGGYACDPSEHNEANEKRCEVSKFYGRNGQRRQFRLLLYPNKPSKIFEGQILIPSGRVHQNRNGNTRAGGWYVGGGFFGNVEARIVRLGPEEYDTAWILPLKLIHYWGALGAKTQNGYGVIQVDNIADLADFRFNPPSVQGNEKPTGLPDLRHMFFTKIGFEVKDSDWWKQADLLKQAWNNRLVTDGSKTAFLSDIKKELNSLVSINSIPIAPTFRNWLRYGDTITVRGKKKQVSLLKGFLKGRETDAEREIFGQVRQNNNRATRIHISSAYQVGSAWEIRIWGWIPSSKNYNRDQVLKSLNLLLGGNETKWTSILGPGIVRPRLIVWREYNSERDIVRQINNPLEFLKSLVKGEGA